MSLTVVTPGPDCSFNLTSLDGGTDGAECLRQTEQEDETNEVGGAERNLETKLGVEEGDVFICELDHLEPGTTYQLQVLSQKDNETSSLTLQTRKF